MISPVEADALIAGQLNCLPIESLPLVQCVGAVLRENTYAARDPAPFDRVAMDALAVPTDVLRGGHPPLVHRLHPPAHPPLPPLAPQPPSSRPTATATLDCRGPALTRATAAGGVAIE